MIVTITFQTTDEIDDITNDPRYLLQFVENGYVTLADDNRTIVNLAQTAEVLVLKERDYDNN